MKSEDERAEQWRADHLMARVRYALNDTVRIVTGAHRGRLGTVAGLVALAPEPVYAVAVVGRDEEVELAQSALAPLHDRATAAEGSARPGATDLYEDLVDRFLLGELGAEEAARRIVAIMRGGGGPFAVEARPPLQPLLDALARLERGSG